MRKTVRGAILLITGGAGTMGRLYARRAVDEGARAVVLWDVDTAELLTTVNELGDHAALGTTVHGYTVDLRDLGAIAQSAQKVRKQVGDPDILINNAGTARGSLFWQHDNGDDTRAVMGVNALAPMYLTREFLPAMIRRAYRAARVVNIASTSGLFAIPETSVYAASKSALIGWSESLRLELEREDHGNVRVTTVVPGPISSGMARGAHRSPLAPAMTPEYVLDRVWRAMLAGRPSLMLPPTVAVARALKGVLPVRAWDAVSSALFRG